MTALSDMLQNDNHCTEKFIA